MRNLAIFALLGLLLATTVSAADKYFAAEITSREQFEAMSIPSDGLVRGGRAMKAVVDLRGRKPVVYFVNGQFKQGGVTPDFVKYHYPFFQKRLGITLDSPTFNHVTYFTNDPKEKQFAAATIETYETADSTGTKSKFFGLHFYPQDLIAEKTLLTSVVAIREAFKVPGIPFAVISYGAQQTFTTVSADLKTRGIDVYTIQDILGSVSVIPMNKGEAWGYVKFKPRDPETLRPIDIPVFHELPLDLSVVAGVITYDVQDFGSHIMLKSKERKTPDLVLRDEKALAQLQEADAANRPIHLTVSDEGYRIEPTDDATVWAKYNAKLPKQWTPVETPLASEITAYEAMCPGNPKDCLTASRRFGGKAAKLGFLASPKVIGEGSRIQKKLGYRLTPYGFGVPLTSYVQFVNANPELKNRIEAWIGREMAPGVPPTAEERVKYSAEVRELFYEAAFPAGMIEKIAAAVAGLKKTVEEKNPGVVLKTLKVRSSANVEDMPKINGMGFNGAGLHDSFNAKVKHDSPAVQKCSLKAAPDGAEDQEGVATKQDVDPESVGCAVKAVYASLWNKRAVEERTFRRLDHRSAAMGLAIVPSYNFLAKLQDGMPDNGMKETSNSVLVTRVLNSGSIFGYTMTTQEAPGLVTNPTPGTSAEVAILTFVQKNEPVGITITQFAKPLKSQPSKRTSILNRDETLKVVEVAQTIEEAYCHARPAYYPNGDCELVYLDPKKPAALDMEFKYLGSGSKLRILSKQMREYSGE